MEEELSLLPFQQPELIWSPRLFLGGFTPGRWHKDLDQPLPLLTDFFSQSPSRPQGPQPQLAVPSAEEREQHPQLVGNVAPANTHKPPREEQGALQGRAEQCQTTGRGEEKCLQESCSSGTDCIRDWLCQDHTQLELSASHFSGEHKPQSVALHWLGRLLRPFYALNKQNQSPRVKTWLRLL